MKKFRLVRRLFFIFCSIFVLVVFMRLFNAFLMEYVITYPPIKFDNFSQKKKCFFLIVRAKMSCITTHGFAKGMKDYNTIDDLEGTIVSFGNHKFISSKKYFSLKNNKFVFSKKILENIDKDSEYYLTDAFERLPSHINQSELIILGYAIDNRTQSVDALIISEYPPLTQSFFRDRDSVGPVPVLGAEVVYATIKEIEYSKLMQYLDTQNHNYPSVR